MMAPDKAEQNSEPDQDSNLDPDKAKQKGEPGLDPDLDPDKTKQKGCLVWIQAV